MAWEWKVVKCFAPISANKLSVGQRFTHSEKRVAEQGCALAVVPSSLLAFSRFFSRTWASRRSAVSSSHHLKLCRARECLEELNTLSEAWADTEPCVIVPECEVKTREIRMAVRVLRQPSDPMFRLLIGDCAHNFRCALDHLAYALAIAVSGEDPPPNENSTMFPVRIDSKEAFQSSIARYIAPKKRMPIGMYAAIEGLQPYNRGPHLLLHILSELDNLDKHRFLPLVAASAGMGGYGIKNIDGIK
jgi:hypothetical protein